MLPPASTSASAPAPSSVPPDPSMLGPISASLSSSSCFAYAVVSFDGLEHAAALAKASRKVDALIKDLLHYSAAPAAPANDSLLLTNNNHAATNTNTLPLQQSLMSKTKLSVSVSQPDPLVTHTHGRFEVNYACSISGSSDSVNLARTMLLARNPTLTTRTLKTGKHIILNDNDEMKPLVKAKLNEIMSSSNTQITCQESSTSPTSSLASSSGPSAVFTSHKRASDRMDIEIMGTWSDIESNALLQTLVYFDELNGFAVKTLELAFDAYPIIVGRKRAVLNRIMEDSGGANIYLPNYLTVPIEPIESITAPSYSSNANPGNLVGRRSFSDTSPSRNRSESSSNHIYITGPADVVDVAIGKLQHLLLTKKQSLIHKEIRLLRRKIDWLITSKRDQLRKIMYDNGVHIQIPPLGSSINILDVVGDNTVYIERAIRAVMELVCKFYVASILVDPATPPATLSLTKYSLPRIAQTARCEIITSNQGLEVYGTEFAVKTAVRIICEINSLNAHIREIKFHVELPQEHKEFINGKKSGKINKITKQCGCEIRFHEDLNDYNLVIDVAHSSFGPAMEGLKMLEDELPAEQSFFIPETYHKRIIGVGGKNIQRIMKKYGVYVKFSNAEEFALLGGYHENRDNVVARTPAKNAESLDLLRDAVFEVVGFHTDVTVSAAIPRVLHRFVKGFQGLVVAGIERAHGVKIVWPDKESGSDDVKIIGQEVQVQQAKAELMNVIPDVFSFQIPFSEKGAREIKGTDFQKLVSDEIGKEYSAELFVHIPTVPDSMEASGDLEITFILYTRKGADNWDSVKAKVLDFLAARKVSTKLEEKPLEIASFSKLSPPKTFDSFQHFNSALLSSVSNTSEHIMHHVPAPTYTLFEPLQSQGKSATIANVPLYNQNHFPPPNLKTVFESAAVPPSGANNQSNSSMMYFPQQSQQQQPQQPLRSQTFSGHSSSAISAPGMLPSADLRWSAGMPPSSTSASTTSTASSTGMSSPFGASSSMFARDYSSSAFGVARRSMSIDASGMMGTIGSSASSSSFPGFQDFEDDAARIVDEFSASVTLMPSSYGSTGEQNAAPDTVSLASGVSGSGGGGASPTLPVDALTTFLASLELSAHAAPFRAQGIDFSTLLTLTDADLTAAGVKAVGARRRLMAAIRGVNQERVFSEFGMTSPAAGPNAAAAALGQVLQPQQQLQQQPQPPTGLVAVGSQQTLPQSRFIDIGMQQQQAQQQQHQPPLQLPPPMAVSSVVAPFGGVGGTSFGGLLTPSATVFDFQQHQTQSPAQPQNPQPQSQQQQQQQSQQQMPLALGYGGQFAGPQYPQQQQLYQHHASQQQQQQQQQQQLQGQQQHQQFTPMHLSQLHSQHHPPQFQQTGGLPSPSIPPAPVSGSSGAVGVGFSSHGDSSIWKR
ncbi:hypothetical protein HDU82_000986 [Entophlyctis luteolus]|nr:hypothetical protein HDU82_000986 [Entophlyctis luteolus]